MKSRIISATLAVTLLTSPSLAQVVNDEAPNSGLVSHYLNYAKEHLPLIGTTAAIASGLTAFVFYVVGRTQADNRDPIRQRRDALALLAAAAQIVNHGGGPQMGGGNILGGGEQLPGADSLARSTLIRPTEQVDVTFEKQRRLKAATTAQTDLLRESQRSARPTSTEREAQPEQLSRTSSLASSARAATHTLARQSSSASRTVGQKPKVSPAVQRLENLVAQLSDVNSDTRATALRNEIVEQIQQMTADEIGEAAQAAFFWDKMLSEGQGLQFFIAMTVDQLKAALANIVVIWPPRGFAELIDVVDDRIAYLLQPVGNAIDRCLQMRIIDLFVQQLQAIIDQHVLTLQNTELDLALRDSIKRHAKFEKQMRAILQKLKVMCKEEESLKETAETLLPQILAIEETLKKSLKMELPKNLDTESK